MTVPVFVAQAKPEDSLFRRHRYEMPNSGWIPMIGNTFGEATDYVALLFHLAQEHHANVDFSLTTLRRKAPARQITH